MYTTRITTVSVNVFIGYLLVFSFSLIFPIRGFANNWGIYRQPLVRGSGQLLLSP